MVEIRKTFQKCSKTLNDYKIRTINDIRLQFFGFTLQTNGENLKKFWISSRWHLGEIDWNNLFVKDIYIILQNIHELILIIKKF